ncbi:hypothetical protein WN55_04543 [Dufourea novaeangliae]|uniref:Uncharacterized protein n=1 Tax=Dufourea novaeangliae TaxID=178035 RepID=A0A154P190_DUFNO|nr:hypothetical protein WN55_04543 [Dufourea novaeangliae]
MGREGDSNLLPFYVARSLDSRLADCLNLPSNLWEIVVLLAESVRIISSNNSVKLQGLAAGQEHTGTAIHPGAAEDRVKAPNPTLTDPAAVVATWSLGPAYLTGRIPFLSPTADPHSSSCKNSVARGRGSRKSTNEWKKENKRLAAG